MIAVGSPAPDFTLVDQDGEEFTLSGQSGRTLIAFFPGAFTGVCNDQFAMYQRSLDQIQAGDVRLVGISVDSKAVLKAFHDQLELTIPLLADFHPKGEVIQAYGAWIEDRGHANRSLVLVGADGVVEWVHESPTPAVIPPAELILEAVA